MYLNNANKNLQKALEIDDDKYFDEGEKLELYEILFETPESEPDIAEELHTREQVSQELGFEVFDYDDEDGEV